MPISASTELTEFLYISCRKKLPHPHFGAPFAGARGICPLPPTRRYLWWQRLGHINEMNLLYAVSSITEIDLISALVLQPLIDYNRLMELIKCGSGT